MKKLRIVFLGLSLSAFSAAFSALPAFGAGIPPRVDISYSITSGTLEGEVNDTLEIKQENGARSYSISSEGRAKGLLALTQPDNVMRDSEGTITAKGVLRPARFSDQHGKKLPKVAIFDWNKKSLTLQYKGREEQRSLPTDAQDKLSLPYSFIFSSVPGKVVHLHETDGKRLELVRYAVSKETLDTPMGKLETIVLTKQLNKSVDEDGARDKKIWLAVEHHMLPVRIVAHEKMGIVTDQMVTKISYGEQADSLKQGRLQ
ncbi:DUF3108 domain-containing protein [Nitrosovibrio tenuis]|uniref:DUF3108 domain-containing protein n=1 Tax=Nitrosovibrio tenuis TaxID=1233 RepID=A0A1H7R4X6_9PROT|nr:DUF3108 domain-containing protein [Nitrosovibrio tenuis]SEL55179.1 Protein of unknown function [Nitrosovibrio tenuis]